MKYLFKIAVAVYSLFFILTVVMLIFAIVAIKKTDISIPYMSYFTIFYFSVLLITILTLIIHIFIKFIKAIKTYGLLRVFKRIGVFFAIGVAIVIISSLIKYHTLFSLDFFYILIALPTVSIFSFQNKE